MGYVEDLRARSRAAAGLAGARATATRPAGNGPRASPARWTRSGSWSVWRMPSSAPTSTRRTEMHFLDAEQVEALAEAIDPRYATLIRFAAYSGLRPSESTALRVGRLDLLRRTDRVVEAAPEIDGRLRWGGVKIHEKHRAAAPVDLRGAGRRPRRPPS
jgi:integrase